MAVGSPFPLGVTKSRGQTSVDVEHGLTARGFPAAVLRSSAQQVPRAPHDHWPTGLGWSIDDRLRSAGADKGRVLAIWQDQPDSKTPIAAICWHLHDSGPLYVLDAGVADVVDDHDAPVYMALLFLCLRQIAGHRLIKRNRDVLRWTLVHLARAPSSDRASFRRAIQTRAQVLAFETFDRQRPQWTRGWWLAERDFS